MSDVWLEDYHFKEVPRQCLYCRAWSYDCILRSKVLVGLQSSLKFWTIAQTAASDMDLDMCLETMEKGMTTHSCLENFMDKGVWWATVHWRSQRDGHVWATTLSLFLLDTFNDSITALSCCHLCGLYNTSCWNKKLFFILVSIYVRNIN